MKRTIRKLLCGALAITLALSLAAPCFAAESASVTLNGAVTYTNDGTKLLIGIPAFTFIVSMKDAAGNDMLTGENNAKYATVTSSTLGKFSLELPFTATGYYYCHVSQLPGTEEYTSYDKTEYDVVIVVSKLAGGLEAKATVTDAKGNLLEGPAAAVTLSFANARERNLIPRFKERTLTDEATGVAVSGTISTAATLKVTAEANGVYALELTDDYRDALTVSFPVKEEDGVLYTVGHTLSDGTAEYLYGRVKDKLLPVKVTELGGFVYAKGFASGVWTNPYSDVARGQWYYENVAYVSATGLMEGDGGKFSPNAETTRAMFITVLYRMDGNATSADAKPWYAEAQAWAVKYGISDGKNMEAKLTREQMAALLYNYEKLNGGGFTGAWMFQLPFADVGDISGWAYEGVAWCYMNGLMQGDNGYAAPQGSATRAQVAALLNRYCEL